MVIWLLRGHIRKAKVRIRGLAKKEGMKVMALPTRQAESGCSLNLGVGATIAWLCSATKYCTGVNGFYGNRIRDYCFIETNKQKFRRGCCND